jgi:hypothetical protein
MKKRALAVDPGSYTRHALHGDGRVWAESNCYVDVWIELLHALGHEPIAALPFTVAIDFEGDQWTFFKFPVVDVYDLYGLVVQELAIWRPLVEHIEEQVDRGRPVLVEVDSFYLHDTAGTAYQRAHVKTMVAIAEIDVERCHLGYFHGQGLFSLDGDDFLDVLRLRGPRDPAILAPYVEFVKVRNRAEHADNTIAASLDLLRKHLTLAPDSNPFIGFKARLTQDLASLLERDLDLFHRYSFATLRQFGACYELAATYLRWLTAHGQSGLDDAARAFQDLSEGAKTIQLQLARSVSRKRRLDLTPLDGMSRRWSDGMSALKERYL